MSDREWCGVCRTWHDRDEMESDHRGGLTCPGCGTRLASERPGDRARSS